MSRKSCLEITDLIAYVPETRLNEHKRKRHRRDDSVTESSCSEKSYEALCTSESIIETIVNLNFNLKWEMITVLANLSIFLLRSYAMVFDGSLGERIELVIIGFVCYGVYVFDTLAMLANYTRADVRMRIAFQRIPLGCVILQCFSMLGVVGFFIPHYGNIVLLTSEALRFYKICVCISLVQILPGYNTFGNFIFKYLVFLLLVTHCFSCVWMLLGCFKSDKECEVEHQGPNSYWTKIVKSSFREVSLRDVITSIKFYGLCVYYINGALTSLGHGGASYRNNLEMFVILLVIGVYILIFCSMLIADLINWQIEQKAFDHKMTKRMLAINRDLNRTEVTAYLREKVLKYYSDFRVVDRGVNAIRVQNILPREKSNEAALEVFWYFVTKCHIFKNTADAFKRSIVLNMHCEMYNKGDILYDLCLKADMMCYIARGTIQILSENDGESPILTLGPGSCIGQMYLLYSFKIRMKIFVPTYTTIYFLKRKELWKTVAHMYKLKQGPILHRNFKNKIMSAKQRLEMDAKVSRRVERKWRCTESKKILSDFKEHVNREIKEIQQAEHLHKNMDELLIDHMYVYSKMYDAQAYDTVFFHTKWPWVLHPHTQLLRIWECIVVLVLIGVALWYPYLISCRNPDEVHNSIFNDLISVIFIFDVVIQVFTATEVKLDVHWRSSEVMLAGLERFSFILDVIAAVPMHLFVPLAGQNQTTKKILAILSYNKLAKFYKVNSMFSYIERMYEECILFVRLVKYAIYLLYFAHIAGSFYLLITCFDVNQCTPNSWIQYFRLLFSLYKGYEPKHDPINFLYLHGFTQVFLVITTTTSVLAVSDIELFFITCLAFCSAFLLSFIIAEYAATIILETKSMLNYGDSIRATIKYMQDNQIPKCLQGRILYSLKAVKDFNMEAELNLYFDCPSHLFRQQKIAKHKQYIKNAPMFQNLDDDIVEIIAGNCTELRLAPQEYVIYSGTTAMYMYIITKGYCAVIKRNNVKYLLGPGTCISALEIVFGVRHVLTVQAMTHMTLIKIPRQEIELILTKNPVLKHQITQSLDRMAYIRLFTSYEDFFAPESFQVDAENKSWCVFKRGDFPDRDYAAVYNRSKCKILRYFLMRRTILPDCGFLFVWELFRAAFAFLMGMLAPPYIVHAHYWPSLHYILWFLSFTALVDVYVRLHVCYYNKRGILVTHPLCTAKYYLSHSFIIDLLGLFPMSVFKVRFTSYNKYIMLLFDCNVLLQMYRFPETISSYVHKRYGRNHVFMQALKCIPFTLIICNALTCILMFLSTKVVYTGEHLLVIKDFSWISAKQYNLPIEKVVTWNFYYISFYCTLTYMFGVGFNKFQPLTDEEMFYFIICLTVGYIFNAYNLVCVIHCRFLINRKLSRYQNDMQQLQKYMKTENLSKTTQKNVITYFEHFWRMTAGLKHEDILRKCHNPLRVDFVLSLYEPTFRRVPIFIDAEMHFYRRIALVVHVLHLRKGSVFIRMNDIVGHAYIVHKGEVLVHDPVGTLCAVLEKGSMFGNIDDVVCTRSMVQYTINATTDLIYVETTKLYEIIRDFPNVHRRIDNHIVLNNLSYVAGSTKIIVSDDLENSQKRSVNPILRLAAKKYFFMLMIIAPLVSCIIASYQLAFFINNYVIDVFLYVFDVLHIIKVILQFFMPYYDGRGDMVIDRRLIRKRYMQPMKFYFDCLTIPPYTVLCLLAPEGQLLKYRRLLGSYRILRAFNVYKHFDLSSNELYANHVLIRFVSILVNTVMVLHLGACIMYFYVCPFGECTEGTWLRSKAIKMGHHCDGPYICSLFYMLSILTSTGFEKYRPTSLTDMLFCMVTILLSKYIVGAFIGDICSLFRDKTLALLRYDFQIKILKTYLSNRLVSKCYLEKIDTSCKYLWVQNRGRQIPSLLLESPNFLIGEVKIEAYGKHLFMNEVFSKFHKDFLRVLIRKLKMQTFFCGDTICKQEDTNNTMYFIHRGKVDVYSILGEEEIHVDELQELDCFGIIQGIYPHTPHTHSYKATTVCVILMLVYDDWYKLLTFFPSAKLELKNLLTWFN